MKSFTSHLMLVQRDLVNTEKNLATVTNDISVNSAQERYRGHKGIELILCVTVHQC